jgi:hypothetical protein
LPGYGVQTISAGILERVPNIRPVEALSRLNIREVKQAGVIDAWRYFHDHPEASRRDMLERLVAHVSAKENLRDPKGNTFRLSMKDTFDKLTKAPLTTPAELGIAKHPELVAFEKERLMEKKTVMTSGGFNNAEHTAEHIRDVLEERANTERERFARDNEKTGKHQERAGRLQNVAAAKAVKKKGTDANKYARDSRVKEIRRVYDDIRNKNPGAGRVWLLDETFHHFNKYYDYPDRNPGNRKPNGRRQKPHFGFGSGSIKTATSSIKERKSKS